MNGNKVRHWLIPDFAYGAHGLEDSCIPDGEIWLDSDMSVEMAYYSVLQQVKEHQFRSSGMSRAQAYDLGLDAYLKELKRQEQLCKEHEKNLPPVQYGVRNRGTKLG